MSKDDEHPALYALKRYSKYSAPDSGFAMMPHHERLWRIENALRFLLRQEFVRISPSDQIDEVVETERVFSGEYNTDD